jgi:hypothetical protein
MAKRTIPKKKLKRVPRMQQPKIDWPKALSRQTKAALIDQLVELIEDDRGLARRLAQRFQIESPPEALIEETRQAITDATECDHRQMNYNFDYDYAAYQTVEKNFGKMIKAGLLESAMVLALELMKSGSEQVEISDEGLMTGDIEDCLRVVIAAMKSADLPAETQRTWAKNMQRADSVDLICDEELQALAKLKQ